MSLAAQRTLPVPGVPRVSPSHAEPRAAARGPCTNRVRGWRALRIASFSARATTSPTQVSCARCAACEPKPLGELPSSSRSRSHQLDRSYAFKMCTKIYRSSFILACDVCFQHENPKHVLELPLNSERNHGKLHNNIRIQEFDILLDDTVYVSHLGFDS